MRVERVGRTDRRRPTAIATAGLLLVLAAIAKPWGMLDLGPPAPAPARAAGNAAALALRPPADSPGPTPIPTPTGDQVPCLAPSGWRLATLEVGPLGDSRSWLVVSPVVAAGPLDPIAAVSLRTDGVVALGFCGPGASLASAGSRIVGAWRLACARRQRPCRRRAPAGDRTGGRFRPRPRVGGPLPGPHGRWPATAGRHGSVGGVRPRRIAVDERPLRLRGRRAGSRPGLVRPRPARCLGLSARSCRAPASTSLVPQITMTIPTAEIHRPGARRGANGPGSDIWSRSCASRASRPIRPTAVATT